MKIEPLKRPPEMESMDDLQVEFRDLLYDAMILPPEGKLVLSGRVQGAPTSDPHHVWVQRQYRIAKGEWRDIPYEFA